MLFFPASGEDDNTVSTESSSLGKLRVAINLIESRIRRGGINVGTSNMLYLVVRFLEVKARLFGK